MRTFLPLKSSTDLVLAAATVEPPRGDTPRAGTLADQLKDLGKRVAEREANKQEGPEPGTQGDEENP